MNTFSMRGFYYEVPNDESDYIISNNTFWCWAYDDELSRFVKGRIVAKSEQFCEFYAYQINDDLSDATLYPSVCITEETFNKFLETLNKVQM